MNRRGSSPWSNIRWGLGGVGVLLVMLYLLFGGTTNPFASQYTVKAIFQSAASEIQPKSPVRIAGVNVGEVTNVQRGPGTTALVTMAISSAGRPVHRDASVKIRPRLFLEGNFFVDMKPGSPSAPEMKSGQTIPLSQTAIPVQVDQVLDTFTADARTGMQDTIKGLGSSLQHGGGQALANFYKALSPTGPPVARAFRAFQGQKPDDLSAFIRSTATVAGAINAHNPQLADLVTSFKDTMAAFADRQQNLRQIFAGLDKTFHDAGPTLNGLDAVLPPLRQFADALRPALHKAPKVLDDSQPFLTATAKLVSPGKAPALLAQLVPSVTQLNGLEQDLPAFLNQVTPVANCVADNIVPVLNKQIDDGQFTTNQPVWQELIRFPVGLGSAAQNFSGNGYSVRYSFGLDQTAVGQRLVNPDALFMLSSNPVLGARPLYTPGHQPPFKPDVPCSSQPVTSLDASNGAAPANQTAVRIHRQPGWSASKLKSELKAAVAAALKGKKK